MFPSEGDLIHTVNVEFRPRKQCKAGPYKSVILEEIVVGIPRLVLIVPTEELPAVNVSHMLHLGPHSNPSFNPRREGEGYRETAGKQVSRPSLSRGSGRGAGPDPGVNLGPILAPDDG